MEPEPAASTSLDLARATTQQYRIAGEARDLDQFMETLAPDVVLHSPITRRASFAGREQLRDLYQVIFGTVSDVRFHTDIGAEHERVLIHHERVSDQELEVVTLAQLNEQAKISKITLWVRPLPGLTALAAALGPRLARQYGRGRMAIAVTALMKPLTVMTRVGDQLADQLIRPNR